MLAGEAHVTMPAADVEQGPSRDLNRAWLRRHVADCERAAEHPLWVQALLELLADEERGPLLAGDINQVWLLGHHQGAAL